MDNFDIIVNGNCTSITGEQFEYIKKMCKKLHKKTGLDILITQFYVKYPIDEFTN